MQKPLNPYDPDCPECGGSGYRGYYTRHLEQSIADSCECSMDPGVWAGDRWLESRHPGFRVVPAKFYGQLLVPSKVKRFVVHCGASGSANFASYFSHPVEPTPDGGKRWRVVSAHGAILDDCTWEQYVPYNRVAWGARGANFDSIHYELQGPPTRDDWPDAVIETLATAIGVFRDIYPLEAIHSHRSLAPMRRTDPGPNFPWTKLQGLCPGLAIVP